MAVKLVARVMMALSLAWQDLSLAPVKRIWAWGAGLIANTGVARLAETKRNVDKDSKTDFG